MHHHGVECIYYELYMQTLKPVTLQEQKYIAVSIWKQEFDQQVRNNGELQKFIHCTTEQYSGSPKSLQSLLRRS